MNDTTRRFLDEVLARVPEARLVEIRLFPAIRQGGIESGVAVLAVEPDPALDFPEAVDLDLDGAESVFADADAPPSSHETPVGMLAVDDDAPPVDAVLVVPRNSDHTNAEAQSEASVGDAETAGEHSAVLTVVTEGSAHAELAVPDAGEPTHSDVPVDLAPAASDRAEPEPEPTIALGDLFALPEPSRNDAGPDRLAILCARYKLLIKGPDRGKWDLEIVHQADAPLDSLDLVIKGVVRRSGDVSEPERYTRHALRELLDAPAWVSGG
jgi:hypothetical protein